MFLNLENTGRLSQKRDIDATRDVCGPIYAFGA